MGRPDSDPPSPSPMDRSSTSDCNEGQFQPSEAANNSRKKWIALGLSLCLILVLLIAVIVLATSKNTPPPCPNPQNISVVGSNDHLKSGGNREPSIGESRMEGNFEETPDERSTEVEVFVEVEEFIEPRDSITKYPNTEVQGGSNSSEAGQRPVNLSDLAKLLHLTDNLTKEEEIEKIIEKFSDDRYRDYNNFDSFEVVTPAISNPNETEISGSTATMKSTSEVDLLLGDYDYNELDTDTFEETPVLELFDDDDANGNGIFIDYDKKIYESDSTEETGGDREAMMAGLTKFWNEIESLSLEEQAERFRQEYGDNPEVQEMIKIVEENKHEEKDDLMEDLNSWKNQAIGDDYTLYAKDMETPDDDHSNEHHSRPSSGLLAAFLDSFQTPEGQKPNVTIADFYDMVEALADVMQEIQDEKDAPDSIEEFLSFLNTLRTDIELLSMTQRNMDIQTFLNSTQIDRVNRLWADYVTNSNSIVYAKIQQALKEVGAEPFKATLTAKEKDEMRKKEISLKWAEFLNNLPPTGRSAPSGNQVECDPNTELACDDGNGCYSMEKKCDRYIDCVYDRSDEKNCPCLRYLDPSKICDGYPDCEFGEDETGCVCQPWEHNCGFQGAKGGGQSPCIDIGLRCDNVEDCNNANDEMNCLSLRSTPVASREFPRQEVQGLLHIQKSQNWYVFAVDVSNDQDVDKYTDLLNELASEVCQSTIRSSGSAQFKLVDLNADTEYEFNLDVAHLQANFHPNQSLTRFYDNVGRFDFSIKPAFKGTTKAVRVECVQTGRSSEQCGRSVNDGNDPFAVFNLGQNYQRPSTVETIETRIVGGMDSRPTKWPYAVSLHRNGYFKCGASIIDPQWILTAAHCVYNFTSREDYFEVRGGIYRQNSLAFSETVRKLVSIYIYPEYNDQNILHDIALAKLDRPFDMDTFTATVCLPKMDWTKDIEDVPKTGDKCWAVGWGILDAESTHPVVADTLQEVEVPILDNCTKRHSNASMYICGGFAEGGKDTCQGDSGGPLFCKNEDNQSWYLAGVISHGKGCALANSASFYTRVSLYKDWIREITNGYVSGRMQESARSKQYNCPSGVSCDKGRCVPQMEICDWRNDCFDGLDEEFCTPRVVDGHVKLSWNPGTYAPTSSTTTPKPTTEHHYNPYSMHEMKPHGHHDCIPGSFICKNVRQCISNDLRCDLKPDCIDGSDETDCTCKDYFEAKSPQHVCDGYPDCYDFSDELGCQRCNGSADTFFCHLSKKCIKKSQVCDEKYDCHFQEDERYCMALTKNDHLGLNIGGKPVSYPSGFAAVNYKGNWRFICTSTWTESTSNKICKYLGYLSMNSHKLVSNDKYPHLAVGHLSVGHDSHQMYKRDATDDHHEESAPVIGGRSSNCQYVELNCKPKRTCGQLPLYSSMGKETPTFGEGATPWTAGIYIEGVYTCGATLVNPRWLLTHRSCAQATMPEASSVPQKYATARLGAYLDNPTLHFLSGHEQVIRIARSLIIPESDIALIKLESEATLTEYVHTICLPNTEWVPINAKCFIHGRHAGVFNHAIETKITGKCNEVGDNFDICTEQEVASGECLDNWSGTLVCPDLNGNLYAVGIYHSGPSSDCEAGGLGGGGSNIPDEFVSIVSNTAREAIVSLVSANAAQDDLNDDACNRDDGRFRCPIGTCLNPSQVCDGIPQCEDGSDENSELCTEKIRMCEQVNATHCECLLDDMMCDNLMCLTKDKFCDGVNDCGDNSDEPANCENDCSISLATHSPEKICDANIDCIGEHDLGNDESVERCCTAENTLNNYRCALGHHPGNVSISDECIPRNCVCDWDVNRDDCPSCLNGADEVDCMSIYGHKKHGYYGYGELTGPDKTDPKSPALDAFGRSKTQPDGYVYFTAHGRDYLYCASKEIFTEERRLPIGDALCKHENFEGVRDIAFISPFTRTIINPSYILPSEEQSEFDSCQIIYLSCIVSLASSQS